MNLGQTNLAQLSAQAAPVVNYAFGRGVLRVAVVSVAGLIYRFLASRLSVNRSRTLAT